MSRSFHACAAAFAAMIVVGVGSTRSAFAVATSDYAKKMTLTVNASRFAQSDGSISGLPVPVRLSTAISGFSYGDITQTGSSKDLYFVDGENNVLPYEIEKWNEQGESIVWVRVPTFAAGAHIYMYYGGPAVEQNSAAVWNGYVGVWHMAEADSTVADATGHGLTATPAGDAPAQSVATTGPVGNGRVNATDGSANRLEVSYDSQLDLGDTLSFSGWVHIYGVHDGGRMVVVTRKYKLWNDGWNVSILQNSSNGIGYWGKYNNDWGCLAALNVPDLLQNWVHVAVTYNGNTGYMYINGQRWATVRQSDWTDNTWIQEATDTDQPLTFGYTGGGNWDDGWSRPFKGAFDEFRLSDGVLDATRIKAEYVSQAYADALVYEVSEVQSGSVTLADAVTSGIVSADGKNTLTVTANVTALNGESAKVFLAVGVAEPKDGDPALRMSGVITNEVTAVGTTTFVWDGAVLGTKIAYAVMNVVGSTTNATATTQQTLQDVSGYRWVPGVKGLWSDASNWTRNGTDDGLPRLGYPSYGSTFTIYQGQSSEVLVDAKYEGLNAEERGSTLGWGGDTITLKGVVDGAAIDYPKGSGFKDGQYDNVQVILDGVSLTCGSYDIKNNSSLTLLNGAYLYTTWEVDIIGTNASLFVGDGCEIVQNGGDGIGFGFGGENASVVISNGVIRAHRLAFGAHGKNSDTSAAGGGATPAGFVFCGEAPQLQIATYAKVYSSIGDGCAFDFSIPADGFAKTPIVKTGTSNHGFIELASSEYKGLLFSIDEKSPYLAIRAKFHQPLVDWTYNESSYTVNADAIAFAATPGSGKTRFYFTPESEGTKNGVSVYCYGKEGFAVVVR